MNSCDHLDGYLDKTLSLREQASFASHLSTCIDCSRDLSDWSRVQATLIDAFPCDDPAPTRQLLQRLLCVADSETLPPAKTRATRKIALWAAAAAAAIAGVLVLNEAALPKAGRQNDAVESLNFPVKEATSVQPTPATRRASLPAGLQTFGGHRIWVEVSNSVTSKGDDGQTIELAFGSLAVASDDRSRPISISAGRYTVRDIGTVFSVSYTPNKVLEVTVAKGLVEVDGFGEMPVRVQPKQRLSIVEDAFVRLDEIETHTLERVFAPQSPAPDETSVPTERTEQPKAAPKAVDIAQYRRMVLDGKYEEAAAALTDHLGRSPNNAAAWSILSDCYRKQHRWQEALDANDHVIKRGTPAERQRALFLNGEIYQDHLNDPASAAAIFDRFSASSKPSALRAAALLRAAEAHLALGNRVKALGLIREINEGPYDAQLKAKARALRDDR